MLVIYVFKKEIIVLFQFVEIFDNNFSLRERDICIFFH